MEPFIDIAAIPLVILSAIHFRATRICKMVMFAKRESNLSDEGFFKFGCNKTIVVSSVFFELSRCFETYARLGICVLLFPNN